VFHLSDILSLARRFFSPLIHAQGFVLESRQWPETSPCPGTGKTEFQTGTGICRSVRHPGQTAVWTRQRYVTEPHHFDLFKKTAASLQMHLFPTVPGI